MSHPQFSVLYIISFVVITVGFIMFNVVPTYSALPGDDPGEVLAGHTAESSSHHLLAADTDPDAQRPEPLTAVAALWLKLTVDKRDCLSVVR